jgi:outer membrane protein assembly factor BamB/TolB-like protein
MMNRRTTVVMLLLCLVAATSLAVETAKPRRIAVLEFENITKEKSLDWMGTGIAETLTTQLSQIPQLTVVERSRLGDIIKELKLNRSQSVDPSTAQKMGRILGAQSLVVGSYQQASGTMRINARVVDVETGEVKSPTLIDGPSDKFFDLQVDLSKKIVTELKGTLAVGDRKQLESAPAHNLDAYRAVSEGIYFLRSDMVDDAIAQFDQAIQIDPQYAEAYFHKGLALEKKQQWDDAAASFKRALPRSQRVQSIKWTWDAPFEDPRSERGRIPLMNLTELMNRDDVTAAADVFRVSDRIVYAERVGAKTVLHLVDLTKRSVDKMVVDDAKIPVSQLGQVSGKIVALRTGDPVRDQKATLAIVNYDSHASDRMDLGLTGGVPFYFMFKQAMLIGYPATGRWFNVDAATRKVAWQRDSLSIGLEGLDCKPTRSAGDVMVVRTGQQVRAIKWRDGQDLWVADLQGAEATLDSSEDVVVAMEHSRRVALFDLETGAIRADLPLQPGVWREDTGFGNLAMTPHLIQRGVLYVWTKDKAIAAVDLRPGITADKRLRWRTPLARMPRTFVQAGNTLFAGNESGELVLLDAEKGSIRSTVKLSSKSLSVNFVNEAVAIASSAEGVFGLDPVTGAKKWMFASRYGYKEPFYFKGVVVLRSGERELSVLDADTGNSLWQYSGKQMPFVHTTEEALFIAEEGGVKEYSVERTSAAGLTEKEVVTELARAYLEKGSTQEAAAQVARVLRDMDRDYAPARYLQGRILKAQGKNTAAAREFITYLNLEGAASTRARDTLAELTREFGLLWRTELNGDLGSPRLVQDKLVTIGPVVGEDPEVVALESTTGRVAWRHAGQRFVMADVQADSGQLYYATGRHDDPRVADVFSVIPATGERRAIATLTHSKPIDAVDLRLAGPNLYLMLIAADVASPKQSIRIVSIRTADGQIQWERSEELDRTKTGGFIQALPDRLVYSFGREVSARNAQTGDLLTFLVEPEQVLAKMAPRMPDASPEWVFWTTADRKIVAYNLARKQVAWRFEVPDQPPQWRPCACVISGLTLYEADKDSVVAVDAGPDVQPGQRIKWRTKSPDGTRFEGVILRGGRVFAYLDDNTLLELDPGSGQVRHQYPFLWAPSSTEIIGDTAYIFASDAAYALTFKK